MSLNAYKSMELDDIEGPIPGGVQGQVVQGLRQPGLVVNGEVGGPACGRGVGDS